MTGPAGPACWSYCAAGGFARRQRFTKDHKESEQLYRRWVIEHYDHSADIVIRDGSGFNATGERKLLHIANALVQHDEGRVRPDAITPDERYGQV